ncbi:MAG: MaoC family dehydratase [Chloroflexi bacterium]|nr:MaoC family dehydratase [Chloroflexota bacterium]
MSDSELSFDSIEVGKLYGPYYYPLEDRFARYLEAVENEHEWHTRRSPAGPPVAPSTILGVIGMRFIDDIAPVPPGTLHIRQEIEIKNWIRSDRVPILYGEFTDKSEKRGRKRFTFEASCRDGTGLILGTTSVTMAFPVEEEGRGQNEGAERPGQGKNELTAISRTLTQEKMTAYSEDSANAQRGKSIHIQADIAKAAGFETTVAQGLMAADYIGEMMERKLGRAWYESAGLSLAFLAPPLCGQTLTTGGRLAEEHEEGAVVRQVYEVWCDNDAGETVAAGTATALAIPSAE